MSRRNYYYLASIPWVPLIAFYTLPRLFPEQLGFFVYIMAGFVLFFVFPVIIGASVWFTIVGIKLIIAAKRRNEKVWSLVLATVVAASASVLPGLGWIGFLLAR